MLERGRKLNSLKSSEPLRPLRLGERSQVCNFFFESTAFDGKFVVELNHFSEHAWQKTERQQLQNRQMFDHEFPRLRRISIELFGFEFAWEHRRLQNLRDRFSLRDRKSTRLNSS